MAAKQATARLLLLINLFTFCWIALITRNFLLITFAYLATSFLFLTKPFSNLLRHKDILLRFLVIHFYVLIFAFFPHIRSLSSSLLILGGFLVFFYLVFFRLRNKIEAYLS